MFIFISNAARDYAWGDAEAIPELLGEPSTGNPQAELWLGTHVDDPAELSHETERATTLLDLIEGDADKYGVDGAGLPFLLKVLGIAQTLSLQAHPNRAQAIDGFARENELGVARDAPQRNYRDENHKPEVVVALSDDFAAFAGFRALAGAVAELRALAALAGDEGEPLADLADWLDASANNTGTRRDFLNWVFSGVPQVDQALTALRRIVNAPGFVGIEVVRSLGERRTTALREMFERYPGDAGPLISLLMHCIELAPGEALYIPPGHLHAYLSGVGIEVMASSDNVLRAGLTPKHVDVAELTRVLVCDELEHPLIDGQNTQPGVTLWQPDVPDFSLRRVRVQPEGQTVSLGARYPLVLICTEGKVNAERENNGLDEYASVARGQALYISAGAAVTFSGNGELFVATVGESWGHGTPVGSA